MNWKTRTATYGMSGALAVAASIVGYFEGRNLFAYLDPVGIPTICEGVTNGVRLGDKKTEEECDVLLELEIRKHARIVDKYVTVEMKPNEYAAWISFVYNVGGGNFSKSTALKKLNAGDHIGACNEMTRWVYAKGKKLNGLVNRRLAEKELCLSQY